MLSRVIAENVGDVFFETHCRCYGWGATSEYGLEIVVLEVVRPVSAKISGRWARSPPTIFARLDNPVNALQLCRWQYSHKDTS